MNEFKPFTYDNNGLETSENIVGYWQYHPDNEEITLSKEWDEFFSIPALGGRHDLDFLEEVLSPHDYYHFITALKRSNQKHPFLEVMISLDHKTGKTLWVKVYGLYNQTDQSISGVLYNETPLRDELLHLERKNGFLKTILNITPSPIFYQSIQGIFLYVNDAFCEFVGIPRENIIGATTEDIFPIHHLEHQEQISSLLMTTEKSMLFAGQFEGNDGQVKDIQFLRSKHFNDDQRIIGLSCLVQDVSDLKAAERLANRQKDIKDVMIDLSQHIASYEVDQDIYKVLLTKLIEIFPGAEGGSVLRVQENKLTIDYSYNFLSTEVESFEIPLDNSYIYSFSGGDFTKPGIIQEVASYVKIGTKSGLILKNGRQVTSTLFIPVFKEGSLLHFLNLDSSKNNAFSDVDLSIAGYLMEQVPILNYLSDLNRRTLLVSRIDALTGLYNRRYFEERANEDIHQAALSRKNLFLVMYDLDGLKQVNDQFGHQAGDAYIKAFSEVMNHYDQSQRILARIGGDEFAGLYGDQPANQLIAILQQAQEAFSRKDIRYEDQVIFGRFSFGLASIKKDGFTLDQLMSAADDRMYMDKKAHRKDKDPAS